MTDPKHAYEKDAERGRYYRHPVTRQDLVSVTNVLSTGFTKWGLPKWYANSAADYALDNLPTIVARSRTDRDTVRKEISAAAETIRDDAAHLGTRIHSLADAHLTGKQLAAEEGDAEAGLYVAQYLRFLKDFGVDITRDVVAAELTVADPVRGFAGTLDAIIMLALDGYVDGKVKATENGERKRWLIDVKTSRTRASTQTYPDHCLQLAALRHAREMWMPDDTIEPMLTVAGCAVLNLRAKTYKLIPLPAAMPEFKTFLSILDSCRWLHTQWSGEYDHRPITPSGRFEPKRGAAKKAANAASLTEPSREVA